MEFSVLISCFHKEKASTLNRALISIWDEQSLQPNQIIFVKDGPLTEQLDQVIENWALRLGSIFNVISLETNHGLGDALAIGLKHAKYELIARMDTDDISLPNRFFEQIQFFKNNPNTDILGSNIIEFDDDEETATSQRNVPNTHAEIIHYALSKNPFNHPSVMYKKSSVLRSGGSKNFTGFEDYYLWVRMIMDGSKCANIKECLLKMRSGQGQIERRGGINYAKKEFLFQNHLLAIGFISKTRYIFNLCARIPPRILPRKLRKVIYTHILRDKTS